MQRVALLIASAGYSGWWKKTILHSDMFKVVGTTDCSTAFSLVLKTTPDLFVIEEYESLPRLQSFLVPLRSAYRVATLKGIVITPLENPEILEPPVCEIVAPPVTVERFNAAVARAVGMQTRTARRYLIRMMTNATQNKGAAGELVITEALSTSGMLVQSAKRLPVGQKLFWSFTGVSELKGVVISGTILREEAPRKGTNFSLYVVQFDEESAPQRQYLGEYLREKY